MNKTFFALMFFAILSLAAVAANVSAAESSDLTINPIQSIMTFGQNASFTITNTGNKDLTNIVFEAIPTTFEVGFNPKTITSLGAGITSQEISLFPTKTTNLNFGDNTIKVNAKVGSVILASQDFTFKKSFCDLGPQGGNLSVRSVDINNEGTGDDDKWVLLDTIEVQVDVKNTNDDEDITDVTVELALFDSAGNDASGDLEFEGSDDETADLGRINNGDTETATFRFKVPADFNADESYDLAVKAFSKDSGENKECADNDDGDRITIDKESDDDKMIVVDEINLPSQIVCGETASGTFRVFNIGDNDQDDVILHMRNAALKLDQEFNLRQGLDEGDDQEVRFSFNVPTSIKNDAYTVEFSADYDDGNSGPFFSSLKVIGCTDSGNGGNNVPLIITATPESDQVMPGDKLVVRATIRNTGSDSVTLNLDAQGFQSWADLDGVSPGSLTLDAGQSRTVTYTFTVNDDASGAESFIIEARSTEGAVETQEVEVNIEGSQGSGFSFSGSTWLWAIGVINVILIVLIIVVVVRLASK